MPGSIKIDDGSGNYTILTNAGSLGSDKTITIPNETATLATTTAKDLGGAEILGTATGTVSDITFSNFVDTSVYTSYKVIIYGFRPTSSGASLRFTRLDSSDAVISATYTRGYRYSHLTGSTHSSGFNDTATDYWAGPGITGNNGDTQNYIMDLFPEDDIYHSNHINFSTVNTSGGSTWQYNGAFLAPATATAWKGFKIYASAGNVDVTRVTLYGMKY